MADFDVLIRGGTVVDGSRSPRYLADVGVKDGKVAKVTFEEGSTSLRAELKDVENLPEEIKKQIRKNTEILFKILD